MRHLAALVLLDVNIVQVETNPDGLFYQPKVLLMPSWDGAYSPD